MVKIYYPKNLDTKFYDKTIKSNPDVTVDGFYFGEYDNSYDQKRIELINNYQLTYLCDYWLDGFCWQDNNSFFRVNDATVLRLIEKYYDRSIPFGCFTIAVKHRDEIHYMGPTGDGFDLMFKKKAYFDYLEMYDRIGGSL